MKDLWRKTWELLRDFPILWLPCVFADLLAVWLWRLRGMAEKAIFHWFLTSHSVLGGETVTPIPDRAMLAKASMAYAPVGFATIFAVVCLFVAALMVIARMVEAISSGQSPNFRASLTKVIRRWRRILLISVKFLVACGVFSVAAAFLAYSLLGALHHREVVTSAIFLNLGTLLLACCLALLLTPSAIRLLQADKRAQVPSESGRRAMVFAAVATEAGILLGMLAQKLEAGMVLDYKWEVTTLSALNSILANAPNSLLFVALALLALGNDNNAAVKTDPDSSVLPLDSRDE
jgi:hypothetical protein